MEPEVVVPVLASALQSPDCRLRQCAAHGLGDFGEKAKAAVPALLEALDDPWLKGRLFATNALVKIAPEVLQRGQN